MTDKLVWTLFTLFVVGLLGGALDGVSWLWLCAPFLIFLALVVGVFWLASKCFEGLNLWR